jgi:hypothetical protein
VILQVLRIKILSKRIIDKALAKTLRGRFAQIELWVYARSKIYGFYLVDRPVK